MFGLASQYTLPLLATIGVAVGLLGTLVGAGGGFILVPILLFAFPNETADRITAISIAVIWGNATSGSIAYGRMGKVDFASGWRFALAAIPGAFLGAFATRFLSRHTFDELMGGALILIGAYLLLRHAWSSRQRPDALQNGRFESFSLPPKRRQLGYFISAGVGFVSSILGIGGGIIHVPAMIYLLGYPVHMATATSHFVLAITTFVGTAEHVLNNSYSGTLFETVTLSVGAIIGAQFGARLSTRLKGSAIILALAIAQVLVGLRILFRSL